MKSHIDIVTGFLGSGKTTFINRLIKSRKMSGQRIVVLQCESGEEKAISPLSSNNGETYIKRVDSEKSITPLYISEIIKQHLPHRIIIEHNGMSRVGDLLSVLGHHSLIGVCSVDMIFHMAHASTFDVFMSNMGNILEEQIVNSQAIIINNIDNASKYKINKITKALSSLNSSARVITVSFKDDLSRAIDNGLLYPQRTGLFSKPSDVLFLLFAVFSVSYFLYTVFIATGRFELDLSRLQLFNTVFISILIQAFPFILVGVLISSILQVFVREETIIRLFPRNKAVAFGAAVISGIFFPVCDCAIVPVVGRLVKKGVPLPVAMTFMLAAPIVNPIVIASTFYAFPGQIQVVLLRTALGIAIAVAVGIVFVIFPQSSPLAEDNSIRRDACACGFCDNGYAEKKGFMPKLEAICMHAASEFFEVGRFLVIGAFISTVMLTFIPKEILSGLGGESAASLLVMMAAAFIFSVCSTSDAFIARTFTGQFPLSSIMGFLVLGPMFDIKNLLMLLGSFKKSFVIRLVLAIAVVSFAVLYLLTPILL